MGSIIIGEQCVSCRGFIQSTHNSLSTPAGASITRAAGNCGPRVPVPGPLDSFSCGHVEFGALMVAKLRQRDPPSCQLATASSSLCFMSLRISSIAARFVNPAAHHGSEAQIEMFPWRPALDWRWEPQILLRRRTRVCLRYDGGVPPSSQGQCRLVPCFLQVLVLFSNLRRKALFCHGRGRTAAGPLCLG